MSWDVGTDLRNELGIYSWPYASFLEAGQEQTHYCSVTKVIGETGDGFIEARAWFTALEVFDLVTAATEKRPVKMYHAGDQWKPGLGKVIEVPALSILKNALPTLPDRKMDWEIDGVVHWPKNAGLHYIKGSGIRHLTRLANIGSIMHDAAEEYSRYANTDVRDEVISWNDPLLPDWIRTRIEARGFRITIDDCIDRVMTVLQWCEKHLDKVIFYEAPVFSDQWVYAGTIDLYCTLKDDLSLVFCQLCGGRGVIEEHAGVGNGITCFLCDGEGMRRVIYQLDFKSSKDPYASHKLQHAAYWFADSIGIHGTNRRIQMFRPDRCANLYVHPKNSDGRLDNPFSDEVPSALGSGEMVAEFHEWPVVCTCGVGAGQIGEHDTACESIEAAYQAFLWARMQWQWRNDLHESTVIKNPRVPLPKAGRARVPQKIQRRLERV